jgi:small subunit ribosomal protein S21
MQREGTFREMKLRRSYEKPSERRVREKAEGLRRYRKAMRKRLERGVFDSRLSSRRVIGLSLAAAGTVLFSAMDIGDDERHMRPLAQAAPSSAASCPAKPCHLGRGVRRRAWMRATTTGNESVAKARANMRASKLCHRPRPWSPIKITAPPCPDY